MRVQALHHRARGRALVEPPRHARTEPEQAQAEPVGAAARAGLDPAHGAQAVEQPVDAAARLADPFRELDRGRLAVLRQLVDQRGYLVEDLDPALLLVGHAP